ncbi:hypothetical protein ILUMI_16621 [Ignelater luminosus]|uniref:Uncharacterized protein n=1 Tax=Ignelater luminosus TaxID=2038154 RepID=A0A8K0CSK7_IGNLU|nr:hypothetical protein ILUMI_16621 [Ignelater luminosus]
MMHRLYVDYCKTKNKPYENITLYERVFNQEYNLGFFVLKKDQCVLCKSFKNANGELNADKQEEKQKHGEETLQSRKEKERDKEKPSWVHHCYMWHENLCKRGPNEIGSCVLHFVEHTFGGIGDTALYSDNLPGKIKVNTGPVFTLTLYKKMKAGEQEKEYTAADLRKRQRGRPSTNAMPKTKRAYLEPPKISEQFIDNYQP